MYVCSQGISFIGRCEPTASQADTTGSGCSTAARLLPSTSLPIRTCLIISAPFLLTPSPTRPEEQSATGGILHPMVQRLCVAQRRFRFSELILQHISPILRQLELLLENSDFIAEKVVLGH